MQATAVWAGENRFEVITPNGTFFIGSKPGGPDDSPLRWPVVWAITRRNSFPGGEWSRGA